MKNRIEWIDVSKFIAITIMVMGHIGLPKVLSDFIHIFHMPVFFIMSGMCFNFEKHKKFKNFLTSRVKSLLVPHFMWSIIMYIIWRIYCNFQPMGEYVGPLEFIKLLFTKDAGAVYFGGFGVMQWFFTCLFFAELFMWLVFKVADVMFSKIHTGSILLVGGGLFLVIATICAEKIMYNPLGILTAFLGAFFCIVGYLFKEVIALKTEKILTNIGGFLGSLVFLLIVWKINGTTNMRTMEYGNILLFVIGALAGSYLIFAVSYVFTTVMNKKKESLFYRYVTYIGRNTLIVLIFNRLVQFTVIAWINYGLVLIFGEQLQQSFVGQIVLRFVDLPLEMLLFVPIIYIINRFVPITVGRTKN